ncbi:MAG: FGGY-family carbohydrate kinase [Pseudomonadota bacterium]
MNHPRAVILTFDLGTTRLKVAAFDYAGTLLGQVSRRNLEHQAGQSRWQSADAWWQDAVQATGELMATTGLKATDVQGMSLSGRAGAAVFVDGKGQVIQDPWSDNRHGTILAELTVDTPRTSAGYGPALLAKYCWLRTYKPDVARQVKYILYAKDFLLYRLTGQAITDPSSGPDGSWDAALLDRGEVDAQLLPAVRLPWQLAGVLADPAAVALGLAPGIPVAVGAHDGISANIGAGAIAPGEYALTLGTHAVLRTITRQFPAGARRFYGYPPDRHVIGGNALFAGRLLDWFLDNWFDQDESDRQNLFARLDAEASEVPAGGHGITFQPFPRGTIAPAVRPGARAAFLGMQTETTRIHLYRAILEGTAFALRDILDQLTSWTQAPSLVGVTGSGAKSSTWTGILANVLEEPLTLTDGASEGRGAAICFATAVGAFSSVESAVSGMVNPVRVVEPTKGQVETYRELRQQWLTSVKVTAALDRQGSP